MFKYSKKWAVGVFAFVLCIVAGLILPQTSVLVSAAAGSSKIHFLTLPDNTDAILLESNGKFGMVDSGEDNDYPDGSNPAYPSRPGTTIGNGFEEDVIAYLHSIGVSQENFEFYIGTHPHSDHIGSAHNIIEEFKPKRVYLEKYSDADVSLSTKLWDNLFVYDNMVQAATANGSTLIQSFANGAPLYPETCTFPANPGTIFWEPGEAQASSEEPATSPAPEEITLTLDYQTEDADTPLPESTSIKAVRSEDGQSWAYSFAGIRKYDDTKTPFTYKITLESPGYEFLPAGGDTPYNYICRPISPETRDANAAPEERGTNTFLLSSISEEDDFRLEEPPASNYAAESDNLQTGNISAENQVDSSHPDDPTNNNRNEYAEPGQIGTTDGIVGHTSTPIFYLGGKSGMKIEIMNYGVSRPQEDANDFCLTVKVTSEETGKTAFLSGDINNYHGTETSLAEKLGHIDLLKLSHHGCYGSNTYSFLKALSPEMMILTGNYRYVSNTPLNKGMGPLDTFLKMGAEGIPLYTTGWYSKDVSAFVISLDESLSNNIPAEKSYVAVAEMANPQVRVYYHNGIPTKYTGWMTDELGKRCYFSDSYLATTNKWIKSEKDKWNYVKSDGTMATGWLSDGGFWYYLDQNGFITTGWQKIAEHWYYMDADGHMKTGRQRIGENYYYFDTKNGTMAIDAYVDGLYYNDKGIWTPNYKDSGWILDSHGWWYRFSDGTYPRNTWMKIHSAWYYFLDDGYMATNWLLQNKKWYYLGSSGAMQVGWFMDGPSWYYASSGGEMMTGWQQVGGWYYLSKSGSMQTGWILLEGKWYYLNSSGEMQSNWQLVGSSWYYLNGSGIMLTGWQNIDGSRYYLNGSGAMLTGWIFLEGKWYYLNSSGILQTKGWRFLGGSWYYLDKSGVMQTGWQDIDNSRYYLNGSGAMLSGWFLSAGKWYYLTPGSGNMLFNTWTPDGYYVDKEGIWTGERR